MNITEAMTLIQEGQLDERFIQLYGKKQLSIQKERYTSAIIKFAQLFPQKRDIRIFSTPGRTEVSGNHTDHQNGRVLAGSVDLDIIAVVAKDEGRVTLVSDNYAMSPIELDDLKVKEEEKFTSMSLIRGVASKLVASGHPIDGFCGFATSRVLRGSGISSSAAFEVLMATIFNHLYLDGAISPVDIAIIAQYSENVYFGKPCGLLDQMTCSVGGFVYIDFENPQKPVVESLTFDLSKHDLQLVLVDTGGSHANLSDEYGKMVYEMKEVAQHFGQAVLRDVDPKDFYDELKALRKALSDRCLLRAIHFFNENERVLELRKALLKDDIESFHKLIQASGDSSFKYLQNVFTTLDITKQPLALALALSQEVLEGKGSSRVHGGGLAGTIQAFVPLDKRREYIKKLESVFGSGKCHQLSIRPVGSVAII
ncbi:MAG: galactokinase [Erysipelotrichaceae bacterium]|jgi:galactokinase|nr:galactokinase [Erysipelotrichaceae bacterium]